MLEQVTTGVADVTFNYGNPGDTILVGDWDGDGKDTLGVRRDITYYLRNSVTTGVADIVTSTLWTTMADRFGQIGELLERTAPVTAALSRRLQQVPALKALSARAWVDYGDAYCGGQIEASMRRVIGAAPVH